MTWRLPSRAMAPSRSFIACGCSRRAGLAYGAASGMAAGAANNDYTQDLVKFGPRRIVDRCMADRGHTILNDIGRG